MKRGDSSIGPPVYLSPSKTETCCASEVGVARKGLVGVASKEIKNVNVNNNEGEGLGTVPQLALVYKC